MVHVNLLLWLAVVGAPDGMSKWIAFAGLVVAAFWEHSTARGFLKPKKDNPSSPPAAR